MVPRIKLEDITTVEFRQGSESLFIQTMTIMEPFELPFLKNNFNLKEADSRKESRGIESTKKSDILEKLAGLMPQNRRKFWHSLPVNQKSKDLNTNFE